MAIYAGEELNISDTAVYTYKKVKDLKEKTQYPKVELLKDPASLASTEPLPEVHVQSLESIKYSGNGIINAAVNKNNASIILPNILGVNKEQVFIKPQKSSCRLMCWNRFLIKWRKRQG